MTHYHGAGLFFADSILLNKNFTEYPLCAKLYMGIKHTAAPETSDILEPSGHVLQGTGLMAS